MHLASVGIQKQREEERERTGRGFITFSGCPETTVRHHALACVEKTFLTGGGALHFDMPSVSTERASPGFSSSQARTSVLTEVRHRVKCICPMCGYGDHTDSRSERPRDSRRLPMTLTRQGHPSSDEHPSVAPGMPVLDAFF